MAKKRIIIFAPEVKEQEKIGARILENLGDIIRRYSDGVAVKKFSNIGESFDKREEIGIGGEILVVFDRRVLSFYHRRNILQYPLTKGEKLRLDCLKATLKSSQNLCDERKIPYIIYEGEIEKGEEIIFRKKIDDAKPNVLNKLICDRSNLEIYCTDSV